MEQTEQKIQIAELTNLSSGLEILVQLAEKGEIDPWDINIIDVTDKYLQALDKSPRQNLVNAGRAIFFASVLLRLKSEILLNISNETLLASEQSENFFPEDELLLEEDKIHLDLSKLGGYLVRSSLGKQQRKRKITLDDLIIALKQAEEEEEKRILQSKLRREQVYKIVALPIPDDLLEIVQEQDIDEVVKKIEAIIQEYLTDEKPITLTFLAEILNDKVKPFLALLFLTYMQKVVLEQKEFYGEVFIHQRGTVIKEKNEEIKQEEKKKRKKKKTEICKLKSEVINNGNKSRDPQPGSYTPELRS